MVLLGKIAIVREILKAERASTIFSLVEANGTPKGYELAWVPPFLQLAVGSIKREDIGSAFRNVTVINFNYDRTIEHFLHSRLQSSFDIPADEAKAVVANLKMIRPYGSVGLLPWQDGSDTVPFGAELSIDFDKLSALSKNVRTFTEQNLTDELKSEITSAIDSSRVVVFLGFGFHQQNMTFLKAGRTNPDWYRRVLATVLNVDPENRDNLQTHIARTLACNDPRVVQLLPWHSHRLLLGMKPTLQAALNN